LVEKEWLSKNIQDMFEEKLRDFSVKDDPNFRWCAHVRNHLNCHLKRSVFSNIYKT